MKSKKGEKTGTPHFLLARKTAQEKLKAMDIANVAINAGAEFQNKDSNNGILAIEYLGNKLCMAKPEMTLSCDSDEWEALGGPVRLKEEIFILHYLIRASGLQLTGNLIPFRSMDGGMAYDKIFQARTVDRLLGTLSKREKLIIDIGKNMGGIRGNMGDISLKLRVLPNIELVFVIWKGDDEFPASGNILFDESITQYLPTEDCVVMAETITERIISLIKSNEMELL